MKRPSVILVVMLAIVLVCLAIGGLFVYKNFFVSETEKASVIEEKVEEKKEIPKEPIVFPKEEEMIPEKEIAKKEEIATTVEEPAEPVKETPIISVPKKEKEIAKKAEEETPKAVEIAKTERRDAEKEVTATKPAAETKTAEDAQDIKEITGLITEETMTNTGYKFYENFCLLWKAPEQGIQAYSIAISEKANPSWGSWIQVSVNARMSPTIVWSNVVRPGPEEVVEAAKKAVEATEKYLANYEEYQQQLKGVDMSGDGIY